MIKQNSNLFIAIIVGVFVLSLLLGYLVALTDLQGALQRVSQSFSSFGFLQGLPGTYLFVFIFLNNAVKTFLSLILGVVIGLPPLYFIFTNGELIGLVSALSIHSNGLMTTLAALVPHGIFEIPAVIMSAGYGLWLGWQTILALAHRARLGEAMKFALGRYVKIVLPLLLIGALVEAFITPLLINLTLSR